MQRKKNGFTLVELLAVIVVLGIVLAIAVPSVINYFQGAKAKTEEVFLGNLESAIEQYIESNKKDFSFNHYKNNENKQYYITKTNDSLGNSYNANVYIESSNKKLSDVVSKGILATDEIINPNNKGVECYDKDSNNPQINIYRDQDFVYCFRINLDCVEDKDDAKILEDEQKYDINTCKDMEVSTEE